MRRSTRGGRTGRRGTRQPGTKNVDRPSSGVNPIGSGHRKRVLRRRRRRLPLPDGRSVGIHPGHRIHRDRRPTGRGRRRAVRQGAPRRIGEHRRPGQHTGRLIKHRPRRETRSRGAGQTTSRNSDRLSGGVDAVRGGDRERVPGVRRRGPALNRSRGVGVSPRGGVDGDCGPARGGGRGAVGQRPTRRVGERSRPRDRTGILRRSTRGGRTGRRGTRQPGTKNVDRPSSGVNPIGSGHRKRVLRRRRRRLPLPDGRSVGIHPGHRIHRDRRPTGRGRRRAVRQGAPRRIGEHRRPGQHTGRLIKHRPRRETRDRRRHRHRRRRPHRPTQTGAGLQLTERTPHDQTKRLKRIARRLRTIESQRRQHPRQKPGHRSRHRRRLDSREAQDRRRGIRRTTRRHPPRRRHRRRSTSHRATRCPAISPPRHIRDSRTRTIPTRHTTTNPRIATHTRRHTRNHHGHSRIRRHRRHRSHTAQNRVTHPRRTGAFRHPASRHRPARRHRRTPTRNTTTTTRSRTPATPATHHRRRPRRRTRRRPRPRTTSRHRCVRTSPTHRPRRIRETHRRRQPDTHTHTQRHRQRPHTTHELSRPPGSRTSRHPVRRQTRRRCGCVYHVFEAPDSAESARNLRR